MGGSLRLASKGKILIDPGLVLRDMDGGLAIASGLILVSVGVGTASMIKLPDSATIRSVWTGIPESECLGFCSAGSLLLISRDELGGFDGSGDGWLDMRPWRRWLR